MKPQMILPVSLLCLAPLGAVAGSFAAPFMALPRAEVPHLAQGRPPTAPPAERALPRDLLPSPRPSVPGVGPEVAPPPEGAEGEGLIEQGAKMLLRGIFEQLKPQLEGADLTGQMALLRQLSALLTEIDQFHAPEVLPNGDVLIRRKPPVTPAPSEPEIETGPDGEIDL